MPSPGPSVSRPRIETLTDLIFGLALSISAIALVGSVPKDQPHFLASVAYFAFSFLILINIWIRYTSVVSLVPIQTSVMMRLNIMLLFFVALEPYLFNLLVGVPPANYSGFSQDVSTALALDLGGMTLIIAFFAHVLTREEKGLIPKELMGEYKTRRNVFVLAGMLFVFSVIPQFWMLYFLGEPVRVWFWLVTFPISWARGTASALRHRGGTPENRTTPQGETPVRSLEQDGDNLL